MSNSSSGQTNKKIMIMGLDNSGKTSILLSLQRDTNLLSYYSLNPTRGLDIVQFTDHDTKFNIWDFGGQEQYRTGYLERLAEYLRGVDKIIYVIDIQDMDRYDLSLDYLKKIMTILEKAQTPTEISIFLHKYDPRLETDPNYTDAKIATNLTNKFKEIIPKKYIYNVFKTTIYTIFKKSSFPL